MLELRSASLHPGMSIKPSVNTFMGTITHPRHLSRWFSGFPQDGMHVFLRRRVIMRQTWISTTNQLLWLVQPIYTPPQPNTPPQNYKALLSHFFILIHPCFPLIRPAMKNPYFWRESFLGDHLVINRQGTFAGSTERSTLDPMRPIGSSADSHPWRRESFVSLWLKLLKGWFQILG